MDAIETMVVAVKVEVVMVMVMVSLAFVHFVSDDGFFHALFTAAQAQIADVSEKAAQVAELKEQVADLKKINAQVLAALAQNQAHDGRVAMR